MFTMPKSTAIGYFLVTPRTSIYPGQLTVPQQLDKIEDEGWDIRFVTKEGARYTVLVKQRSFPRKSQCDNLRTTEG